MSEKVELSPCPICQAPTKWCDFGGEKVSGECCDRIVCTGCGVTFDFEDRSECGRDTLDELQSDNLKAFNTRHLPPSVEAVMEAARKVVMSQALIQKEFHYPLKFGAAFGAIGDLTNALRNHEKQQNLASRRCVRRK